jgi:hypothetical protein
MRIVAPGLIATDLIGRMAEAVLSEMLALPPEAEVTVSAT